MAERSESSNTAAADNATLRSNRQRRWEMLNRSLEDDLNRISVVAEDDNGEIHNIHAVFSRWDGVKIVMYTG